MEITGTYSENNIGSNYPLTNNMLITPTVSGMPIGCIIPYFGNASQLDSNWKICNGSTLDNQSGTYNSLATVMGLSANTNITLPNLNNVIPMGVSSNVELNSTGGNFNHSHTVSHTHTTYHTHSSASHTHSQSHSHTLPSHEHSVSSHDHRFYHTHYTPAHGHNNITITSTSGPGHIHTFSMSVYYCLKSGTGSTVDYGYTTEGNSGYNSSGGIWTSSTTASASASKSSMTNKHALTYDSSYAEESGSKSSIGSATGSLSSQSVTLNSENVELQHTGSATGSCNLSLSTVDPVISLNYIIKVL